MSVNVPTNQWRRTSGNGELGETSGNLTTLSGNQLVTLSGNDLVVLFGSYEPVPATEWANSDPAPATEWRPTDGLSEFESGDPSDIVDPLGNNLVDTLGNQIVDTGVTETMIPATEWEEDDSL